MPLYVASSGGITVTQPVTVTHRWRMHESAGTTLADSAGANDLTTSGGPTLASTVVPAIPVGSTPPTSVLFDGSNDQAVTAAAPSGLVGYGFVMAAWFRHVSANNGVPFAYGTSANGWAWLYDTVTSKLSMNQAGVGGIGDTGTNSVLTATWYRVACWCPPAGASGAMRLYVNGILKGVCSAFTPSDNASDKLSIGCANGAANFSNAMIARVTTMSAATAPIADMAAFADYAGQMGGSSSSIIIA